MIWAVVLQCCHGEARALRIETPAGLVPRGEEGVRPGVRKGAEPDLEARDVAVVDGIVELQNRVLRRHHEVRSAWLQNRAP